MRLSFHLSRVLIGINLYFMAKKQDSGLKSLGRGKPEGLKERGIQLPSIIASQLPCHVFASVISSMCLLNFVILEQGGFSFSE